ncbi:MAG: hypothetical protein ACREBC_14810, partial [Pyrinomonadaceae bacterium]
GQHYQFYQFFYNSFGELARVELPTGGAIEYDMTPGSGVVSGYEIYRRVVERRVYADGATLEKRETYSAVQSIWSDPWPWTTTVTVDQLNAGAQLLARSKHYFSGSGLAALVSLADRLYIYPAWNEGQEYQTEGFAADGSTILRRGANTFQQRAAVPWWSWWVALKGLNAVREPAYDPRLTQTVTTLVDTNQVSQQTFSYDQFNNQTDAYQYEFGSGAAGGLIRRTHTDYLTTNPINGTDYTTTAIHIRSLPTQTSVFDASGIERARTAFEVDNYTPDMNHAALTDRPGISGFDSAFTTGYTTRGNATATTRYLLVNGGVTGSNTSFAQYDIAGNVVKTIDGRGNATNFEFTYRFGAPDGEARSNVPPAELGGQMSYAMATKVINALSHTSYAQFDYYTGQPVDGEDVNGIVASGYFNDALDRPTQVRRGVGTAAANQTTFGYDDLNRIITTTSDLNSNNDNLLVSKVLYDGLGRTTEAREFEGGTNYIAAKQIPFVMQQDPDTLGWVRATQSSNPYRPYLSEQPVWTTTFFDALDRRSKVRTPDNAIVRSAYAGNQVTVTDQTGKARKSVTDGLGRLKEVYEDPAGLNYLTSYSYDVLDDLTAVSQGMQTRSFVYDSLKRLTSATNPESGTISYQYDNNGNLTQKTDARSIITTCGYDALNRNTTVDYSDTTGINPDITRVYDSATNGKGRLRESFAGGTETVGANVEHTKIVSYDALGRPLDQRQRFKTNSVWSAEYQVQRGYNLAGGVTSQTYPSGRTVSYGYDNAGRTNSFS